MPGKCMTIVNYQTAGDKLRTTLLAMGVSTQILKRISRKKVLCRIRIGVEVGIALFQRISKSRTTLHDAPNPDIWLQWWLRHCSVTEIITEKGGAALGLFTYPVQRLEEHDERRYWMVPLWHWHWATYVKRERSHHAHIARFQRKAKIFDDSNLPWLWSRRQIVNNTFLLWSWLVECHILFWTDV